VTASAATNYIFVGWYENNALVTTSTTYIFTVNSNRILEARFAINITIAFTRNSVAYTSDGAQVAANQPRFERGQFGKAIMIEEGTTNLLPANKANCEIAPDLTAYAIAAVDTSRKLVGSGSLKVQWGGWGWYAYAQYNIALTNGNTYTVSGRVYAEESKYLSLSAQENASPWHMLSTLSLIPAKQWTRLSVTFTLPSDWTQPSRIQLHPPCNSTTLPDFATIPVWWDAIQVEQKPYATSWTLGGTTRAQETLSISPVSSILTTRQGTIDVWVYVPDFWKSDIPNSRSIWTIGTATETGVYYLGYNPQTNQIEFSIVSDAGTAQTIRTDKPTVGWHLFTTRWSASEMSLWIDGVRVGFIINPVLPSRFADNKLYLGNMPNISMSAINTYIDDFRISSIARTDAEIQTLYQSNQPAPKDADTTLKLTFDGNLTP